MVLIEASSELPPATFERLSEAGSGGSAEVWQALSGDERVALKLARPGAGPAVLLALAREAEHATLALSPGLPRLVDAGWAVVDGGVARAVSGPSPGARAFVALAWARGAPLDPRSPAASGKTPETRVALALRVASDVGRALADLHDVGLAHGDVKPENVVFDASAGASLIDLGLSGPAHALAVEGATLRYLARGDADLGDARARDLLALGTLIAELADPTVAAAADPITAARQASLPAEVAALCTALLAKAPGARPSAAWVSRAAAGEGRSSQSEGRAERDLRRVRAAYLGVRRGEIGRAHSIEPGASVAPFLAPAIAWSLKARSLGRSPAPLGDGVILGPLERAGRARWLVALAGPAASAWPLEALSNTAEPDLARALEELAKRTSPFAWTFRDVEAAVRGQSASLPHANDAIALGPMTAARAARLGLAISRVPPDPSALEAIEAQPDAPAELTLAAADALRLQGDVGRARALLLRPSARDFAGARALLADVSRRAGEREAAREAAEAALAAGDDATGRARAALARLHLDAGEAGKAAALCAASPSPAAAVAEVAALAAAALGDPRAAAAFAAASSALASSAEERARAAALGGYVGHAGDPAASFEAFRAAVEHAARSGAVVEEATYRTGEAAAAVDVGELSAAITTARRAALLWEHLGRPALSARALLAAAAAHAAAGASLDAESAAREAIDRAREGGDARAEAYAFWVLADVAVEGSAGARAAAWEAARLLGPSPSLDDDLRASARLLTHGALERSLDDLDRRAAPSASASAGARLDWWGARAARLLEAPAASAADLAGASAIVTALSALADSPAPLADRGRALAQGVELATRAGLGDHALRLLAALGEAARELSRRAGPSHAAALRALPWVARAAAAPERALSPEQARDLESLVRSFSDRERLRPLLDRIVDALVLWTGVERGLLLLRAPDGRLVPRAARNLARHDLTGEQRALSETLARRALEAREPVVAVDAAGELPDLHRSVHALKLRSVLAVPLVARGEALGVAYLDDRVRRGAFGPKELEWARTIAALAGLAIADARDQVLLRRSARKERRAAARLAETLSLKEAALDVAERELGKARGGRGTRFDYPTLVGESPEVRAMLRLIDRVAAADVPVLVSGESGSGKELVARAIHDHGARKDRPFVSENCGAIPEGLLESALFGHVRGAFTGAATARAGLFEVAHQGTLFLDEIGEMSLGMQTKLLRVLEDGLVRPVGSEKARKVDVRVIAATNRDLAEMVKARTFREDLFYRLEVIAIRIPPLRERAGDVPLLVQHLLGKHAAQRGASGPAPRVGPKAMARLAAFPWPGNVRQLENEIRRALVLADGVIDVEHLSPAITAAPLDDARAPLDQGLDVRARIDALEIALVREAMDRTRGNQTQAAKLLGLSRFGLQKMIKRLSIV